MNWTRLLLAALAAFAVQAITGNVWHVLLFKDLYTQEMIKVARPEPVLPILLAAVAARSLLFSFIYPFGYSGGTLWAEGARFGVLMGLISAATAAIFLGTTNVGAGWFWADLVYFVVDGALLGIAIAYIYGKTSRAKPARRGR